jgi:hypothetical protein
VWLFIFSFPPQTFFPLSSVQSIIHDSEWLFVLFILMSRFFSLLFCFAFSTCKLWWWRYDTLWATLIRLWLALIHHVTFTIVVLVISM